MYTTLYTVWRPKNIAVIVVLTVLINALLFMGLPALTRIAEREREKKSESNYMLTSREDPKPIEDAKEKRLRQKELKQIPKPKMSSVSQQKMDTLKFVFDENAGSVDGLAVNVPRAEGMDIDVGDLTFSLRDVDTPPRVVRPYPVNYPYGAMNKGLRGKVFVKIRVGVDGKATNIEAKRAEPPDVLEVFGEAAEEAVARYRFEPARLGGEAVPVWAWQPISFDVD